MAKASEVFSGFSAKHETQFRLAQAGMLDIRTCCPIRIFHWNSQDLKIQIDANPAEQNRIGLGCDADIVALAYPSNFAGQHINCLDLPKTRENLPRIVVHAPSFEVLNIDMDYYGHVFSDIPVQNARVTARGKADGYIYARTATLFADHQSSLYATILGGFFSANADSQARITGVGEFMQINASAINASRVDTFGRVNGDYIASVDNSEIRHKGDVFGRAVTVPVVTTKIMFYPK